MAASASWPLAGSSLAGQGTSVASGDPLGVDIAALDDLDPTFSLVSGRANLVRALARRLTTPRGSLQSDPDYGLDLRTLVGGAFSADDLRRLEAEVGAELRRDPRVVDATVRLSLVERTLSLNAQVRDGTGPFDLVLEVSRVSVSVLSAAE